MRTRFLGTVALVGWLAACGGSSPSEPAANPTAQVPGNPIPPTPVAPTPARTNHTSIAGKWQGVAVELEFPWTYRVEVTMGDSSFVDEQSGIVALDGSGYPNPGLLVCQYTLSLLQHNGSRYDFRAQVQPGASNCTSGATIRLYAISGDSIQYESYNARGILGTFTRLGRFVPP